VSSLTAYGYASRPGYLYGPYFGEAARITYAKASEETVPAGIEEACKPLPEIPPTESTPSQPTPTPEAVTPPAPAPIKLKVKRVHRRSNGSAVVIVKVGSAGRLKLTGTSVRADSLHTPAAGKYKLIVAPKGATNRRLKHRGKAKVGVKIAFRASGKVRRLSRSIRLSRHATDRTPPQQARSHG
jgi:hypothetical protein